MKPIYQFTWNFKSYRSTDEREVWLFAAEIFGMTFSERHFGIRVVGESDTEIQLERV